MLFMVQIRPASVLFVVLSTVSVLLTGGTLRSSEQEFPAWRRSADQCLTPPYCSDGKLNDSGEPINMNYFTANEDKETKHLLNLVEIAHTNRVLPQISKNDWGGALSDIKYTLNRFPNHPRGLLLMALYARLIKKYALVIPYYEKAIRLYPQYPLTYAQYGAFMVTLGNVDNGIKRLEQAVQMNAELVFAHVWLAAAYQKSGNMELSRQSESKARALGYTGAISMESLQNAQPAK
jgi:Tfp pilus assembly protein PilF